MSNKKLTFLSICLFTCSLNAAFADQRPLSEIMASYQEQTGKSVSDTSGEMVNTLFENGVEINELRDYLSSELAPKDYAKVSSLLNKASIQDVPQEELNKALINIGKGANFRGYYCSSFEGKVIQYGSLIAFAFYLSKAQDKKDDARTERLNKELAVNFKAKTEAEIDVLVQSGTDANNTILAQKRLDLVGFNKRIADAPNAGDVPEKEAKAYVKKAAVAASVAAISFGTCYKQ